MKKLLASILAMTMLSTAAVGMAETSSVPAPSAEQVAQETGFSFADLAGREFTFSSGVGAWSTMMTVNEDGSFSGSFYDSEMGDTGDEYPNGTVYGCTFHGRFSPAGVVNSNTVRLKVDELALDEGQLPVSVEDGIRYVTTEVPYGFDKASEMLLYLPGTPVSELPEGFVSWSHLNDLPRTFDELPYYGLYNEAGDCGFVAMDDLTWAQPADLSAADLAGMIEMDTEHNVVTVRYPYCWDYSVAGGDQAVMETLTDGELGNGRFCITFSSVEGKSGDAQISFGPAPDTDSNTVTASFHVNEDGSLVYKGLTMVCTDGTDTHFYLQEDGKTIFVALEGNPTTGYEWSFVPDNSGAVELVSQEYVQDPAEDGMTGVGGFWLFTLRVADQPVSNQTAPMFVYARSWEPGSNAATYTLQVKLNSSAEVNSIASTLTMAE